jgi:hypothetical protein
MAGWKFKDMLGESAVFLSRSDLVADKHEGTVSLANLLNRGRVYKHRCRKMATKHALLVRELGNIKRWTYVSCWRVDEQERLKCWRTYLNESDGVAIKVNYRRLLERTATIFCAGVEYIDYDKDWVIESNPLLPFTYKQPHWSWEREFRLIIQQFPQADVSFDDALYCDCRRENRNCGINLRVDVQRLIDEIVVAPHASDEYFEEVHHLASEFGLGDRVRSSRFREYSSSSRQT